MPVLATNKRALHNYEILETYEAGLVLSGPEVKSTKRGQIDLRGSYIMVDKNQEAWLINTRIVPYPPAVSVQRNYNPTRNRKLLLHKKELVSLMGKLQQKGLTALPLKVYTKQKLIKIEIGICRGKKKYDKRETIKKREVERKIHRAFRDKNY